MTSIGGTPTRIAWPPRRAIPMACWMVASRPMTSKVTSAPRCSVRSITPDTASPLPALMVSVAPNCFAISSLESTMSTATTRLAPAIRAPWITLSPTPPHPITATVSPWAIDAVFNAAPTPVSTPHPTSAATFRSTSLSIFTAEMAGMMAYSENVPVAAI